MNNVLRQCFATEEHNKHLSLTCCSSRVSLVSVWGGILDDKLNLHKLYPVSVRIRFDLHN